MEGNLSYPKSTDLTVNLIQKTPSQNNITQICGHHGLPNWQVNLTFKYSKVLPAKMGKGILSAVS